MQLADGSGLAFTVREYLSPTGRGMGGGWSPTGYIGECVCVFVHRVIQYTSLYCISTVSVCLLSVFVHNEFTNTLMHLPYSYTTHTLYTFSYLTHTYLTHINTYVRTAVEDLEVSTSSSVRPYDFLLSRLFFDKHDTDTGGRAWGGEWRYDA